MLTKKNLTFGQIYVIIVIDKKEKEYKKEIKKC